MKEQIFSDIPKYKTGRKSMAGLPQFKIKLYADGADLNGMIEEYKKGIASGFTTNPTLMKKAGVKSYEEFAKADSQGNSGSPDLV